MNTAKKTIWTLTLAASLFGAYWIAVGLEYLRIVTS